MRGKEEGMEAFNIGKENAMDWNPARAEARAVG